MEVRTLQREPLGANKSESTTCNWESSNSFHVRTSDVSLKTLPPTTTETRLEEVEEWVTTTKY